MSNSAPTKEELDFMTADLDHALVMGEAWLRLQKNSDFKKVILHGYLRDKVLASHSLLGVPQIKDKGQRQNVIEDLISSSNLKFFFKLIEHEYEGAKNPVLSDDEEIEMANAEAAEAAKSIGGVN
jgi:hypothetical protein